MRSVRRTLAAGALLALLALGSSPLAAEAQAETAGVTLSAEARAQIQRFYESRPPSGAEGLPPGIRRNLARGKALPPGIAKKSSPPELRSTLQIAEGYELVEVGLDVLLVEVATNTIRDVLMDVIR